LTPKGRVVSRRMGLEVDEGMCCDEINCALPPEGGQRAKA